MGVTPAYLESVASFYDLFHLEPVGKHEVLVCTNISCWLRGADDVLAAFQEAAGDDITVRGFECLGACDIAPMASINERYYGPLDPADAPEAISELKKGKKGKVLMDKRLEDRGAAGGPSAPLDKRLTSHPLNKPKPAKKAKPKS
jgi:(2Fe-2S) ferredoxin